MKRKTTQSNAKRSSPPPFPRGFSGSWSSIARPNPTESHKPIDFKSSRKVRFAGIDDDKVPESSSVPSEKDAAQKSNGPKTSEYAFFKKFKENVGHKFQCRPQHCDDHRSNKFESSACSGERTSKIDLGHQSSLPCENQTHAATARFVSVVSPHVRGPTKAGYQYMHGQLFSKKRQKLRQWVTEISFPEIDKLCSEGHDFVSVLLSQLLPQDNDNQSFNVLKTRKPNTGSKADFFASQNSQSDIHFKEIHHVPTSNLLDGEWILSTNVDSSSCRMEMPRDSWLTNSHSPMSLPYKTYLDDEHLDVLNRRQKSDTESDFLDSPKSQSAIHLKEFNQIGARDLMELEWAASIGNLNVLKRRQKSDTESDFLNSPKSLSASHFKEFNQIGARDLVELEWETSIGVGSSSCWMEREREKQLTYSHSPTSLPHKLCFDSRIRKLDYESLEIRTPSLSIEDNSSFGFHIEEHGSPLSNHLMELDEFSYQYPNKLCQREPDTPMLGWDSSSVTDEMNFSIRCLNTPLRLYPVSSSPHRDDVQDNFDNRIRVLREPLLLPYHPINPPSPWCSTSTSHATDNLEEHHIEVKDDLVSFLNNSSLPSSPLTDHLELAEHLNCDAMFEGTLSPQNHIWGISKFLNVDYHHSVKQAVFSPRPDFSFGQKYLPASGSPNGLFAYPAPELSSNKDISSTFLPKYENENFLDGSCLGGFFNHLRKDLIVIQHLPAISFQMPIDEETY